MNQVSLVPPDRMGAGAEPGTPANRPFAILRLIRTVLYFGWMNRNPGGQRHAGCAWPDGVCTSAERRSPLCGPELETGNSSSR